MVHIPCIQPTPSAWWKVGPGGTEATTKWGSTALAASQMAPSLATVWQPASKPGLLFRDVPAETASAQPVECGLVLQDGYNTTAAGQVVALALPGSSTREMLASAGAGGAAHVRMQSS
mmetsp:Transcript_12825/g.27724  ORF Transcript_12825/g.27724 Transcript_12825/m.27724 type:complete len:118 (-) Transcript_12825:32-385(-)